MRIKSALVGILALLAVGSASAQQFPTVPDHTLIGRIGAVGQAGPSQAIPWATVLSKGILDQVGTAQGTIPCRGVSVWGPLVPGAAGTLLSSAGTAVCPTWITTVPVANGGTGSGTAAGARTGLNVESYTAHNDSNYSILSTDRTVGTSAALTAPRTWTLPAANSVNPGQQITVGDYFGGVTSVNTLTIARAGSDTINGANSVVINAAFGRYELRSDGVSKWSAMSSSGSGSSSTLTKAPSDYGAACDGATDDTTAIQAWLDAIKTNAFTGWIPAGKTCIYTGLLSASSGTTIYGYGATFKQKSSAAGSANSGLVCGPTSQLGGPIDNIAIYGLTMDGNRAGNTNTAGSGAMYYCPSATRVKFRDIRAINGRGDGIYVGGTTAGGSQGRSAFVYLENVEGTGNYRNGMSVVGVDRGLIVGGTFNTNNNTNNDGPQCGVDFEPNAGSLSNNTNITAIGMSAAANGGTLSTTGGSGICVFGAVGDTTGLMIYGSNGVSNQRFGIDAAAGMLAVNLRILGMSGTGNASGLVDTANVFDFLSTGLVPGAPNSGGAGFRTINIPN